MATASALFQRFIYKPLKLSFGLGIDSLTREGLRFNAWYDYTQRFGPYAAIVFFFANLLRLVLLPATLALVGVKGLFDTVLNPYAFQSNPAKWTLMFIATCVCAGAAAAIYFTGAMTLMPAVAWFVMPPLLFAGTLAAVALGVAYVCSKAIARVMNKDKRYTHDIHYYEPTHLTQPKQKKHFEITPTHPKYAPCLQANAQTDPAMQRLLEIRGKLANLYLALKEKLATHVAEARNICLGHHGDPKTVPISYYTYERLQEMVHCCKAAVDDFEWVIRMHAGHALTEEEAKMVLANTEPDAEFLREAKTPGYKLLCESLAISPVNKGDYALSDAYTYDKTNRCIKFNGPKIG